MQLCKIRTCESPGVTLCKQTISLLIPALKVGAPCLPFITDPAQCVPGAHCDLSGSSSTHQCVCDPSHYFHFNSMCNPREYMTAFRVCCCCFCSCFKRTILLKTCFGQRVERRDQHLKKERKKSLDFVLILYYF